MIIIISNYNYFSIVIVTVLGTHKKGNQYKVKVPKAETLFLAIESSNEHQRRLLKSSRSFTLNVLDPSGETAFTIVKDVSWGCLPGWLHVNTDKFFFI